MQLMLGNAYEGLSPWSNKEDGQNPLYAKDSQEEYSC